MSGREKILARVKEALKTRTRRPAHTLSETERVRGPERDFKEWLPPVGATRQEQWALFCENAKVLKLEAIHVPEQSHLDEHLQELARSEAWQKIATHRGELTSRASVALSLPVCLTDEEYQLSELESCDAAITECEAIVAQTGSILVSTLSAGGRALSVLPPHHVVLASTEQLLPDLSSAISFLKEKYRGEVPSFVSFITGPSRTGDIERILVLGAHGPKKLTVFVTGSLSQATPT